LLSLLLIDLPGSLLAAGDPIVGKTRAIICIGCHAVDGNSTNPDYPKLAGQGEAYLVKQLSDFKSGKRKEEHMSSMVEAISENDIPHIAAFFSQQKRRSETAVAQKNQTGQLLYLYGQAKRSIRACAQCHGTNGRGDPSRLYPSLAGQHSRYIEKCLKDFRSAERQNDKNGVMRQIASRLSDTEIRAIAHYISSLPQVESTP